MVVIRNGKCGSLGFADSCLTILVMLIQSMSLALLCVIEGQWSDSCCPASPDETCQLITILQRNWDRALRPREMQGDIIETNNRGPMAKEMRALVGLPTAEPRHRRRPRAGVWGEHTSDIKACSRETPSASWVMH